MIINLAKLFKKNFKNIIIKKNFKNFDFRSYEVNFNRLSSVLNNKKFISLSEGIMEIYNFYKNKNINLDKKNYYNLKIVQSQ